MKSQQHHLHRLFIMDDVFGFFPSYLQLNLGVSGITQLLQKLFLWVMISDT